MKKFKKIVVRNNRAFFKRMPDNVFYSFHTALYKKHRSKTVDISVNEMLIKNSYCMITYYRSYEYDEVQYMFKFFNINNEQRECQIELTVSYDMIMDSFRMKKLIRKIKRYCKKVYIIKVKVDECF